MKYARTRRLMGGVALAVLLTAFCGDAFAQLTSDDLVDMLRRLPPEERRALLKEFAAPLASASPDSTERDVSTPTTVLPREQAVTEFEAGVADRGRPGVEEDAPALFPLGPPTGEPVEIRPAFRDFVERPTPLEVDRNIRQFGYELFSGAPTTFAPATDIPVNPGYIIGPGDEIRVQLYGKRDLTTDLVVDRDGMIPFPDIGPITVAGLTFTEMKELLTREVGSRMIGVDISVSMGRLRSIRIFVLGEVFRPGSYTVSGLSTLTNALFSSGGVQKIGSLRNVELKRNGRVIQEMDLYDLLLGGDTSSDVRLMPGDVVFVPPVGALVGIAGEVLRPAIYELKGPMTAAELIDLAGGLLAVAHRDLLQLERVSGGQWVTRDFAFSEAGQWELQDGDILKIYPVLEHDERAVFLEGNAVRPGAREHTEGMRLLDLITSPDDLLPETHFDYGLLERENPVSREPEYVSFDLSAALLDGDPTANITLEARDRVYVFHRDHFRDVPSVFIRGEVRSPGEYEHKRDMRVVDLVLTAGGLTLDAWLDEAELFRTDPVTRDVDRLSIDLGLALEDHRSHNIVLSDLDELAVHSVWEFKDRDHVEILGEVNEPGRYPLFRGMRVSDLVFSGGNLKETAYKREAELTRYEVVDEERRELRHVLIDLGAIISGAPEDDILLEPDDRLLIRRITNWRGDEVVEVTGEVAFPGPFPIESGERLSDLIERFGGFLDDAYLPAAVFTRDETRRLQAEQLDRMADRLESDLARLSVPSGRAASSSDLARRDAALEAASRLVAEIRMTEATGRMVIRLDEAERLRGTDDDVVLNDGDRLHVPKTPGFVMVMGQVHNPTAFRYDEGKGRGHYVRLAGGTTRFADKGKTYVVKADGSVDNRSGVRIGPGDVIIVPETLERFTGMQFLLDISQVLYQLGLTAASAYTVGLFK